MLTIRMQRTGRKGYATFRVVVQDSRFTPTSGRVVAQLGSYNPHTKEVSLDAEKAAKYLANGAQPTPRVVKLLQDAKVKLPGWVEKSDNKKKSTTKNPEKLRKNQPKEETPTESEEPEVTSKASGDETAADATEVKTDETKAEAETDKAEDAEKETPAEA